MMKSKSLKKRKSIKQNVGRAKDYDKEDILKAIKGCGGIVSKVAKQLGCNITTARKYIDRYTDTVEAFECERINMVDVAEDVVLRKLKRGDVQTARWFLARKARDRGYGDEFGISGGLDINMDFTPFAELVKQKLLEEKIVDGK